MNDQNKDNILYGGPVPSSNNDDFKSLGEMVLEKLKIRGDDLMYVSRQRLLELLLKLYSITS